MDTVQSIERALDILESFTSANPEQGLVEMCKKVGLSKGTTFRIVHTLVSRRYLVQDEKTHKYRLGPSSFEVGTVAMSQIEIRRVAMPFLSQLRDQTDETVHLVIPDGNEVLYVEKVDSPQTIRMKSFLGRRLPMHSTGVGKAILAFMNETDVNYIINCNGLAPVTSRTITTPEGLKLNLEMIRERGYAIDDEENEEGLRCVAAPVFDYSGKVMAAISVSSPIMRCDYNKITKIGEMVRDCAERISYQMGYRK